MTHYWTAKQILPRLGYSPKATIHFKELVLKHRLPVYKRRLPGRPNRVWYSNEAMITSWELAKAQHLHRELIAEQEAEYATA